MVTIVAISIVLGLGLGIKIQRWWSYRRLEEEVEYIHPEIQEDFRFNMGYKMGLMRGAQLLGSRTYRDFPKNENLENEEA